MEIAGVAERIASRIVVHEETGCHLWTGCTTKDGYGQVKVAGKVVYVHRHIFEQVKGRAILPNHDLDHLKADRPIAPGPCRFRNCCNLEHMEEVPRHINRGLRMRRTGTIG